MGMEHPMNNFFSRYWFGKVVVTDEQVGPTTAVNVNLKVTSC
jgi:hypothetical protein